MADVAQLAFLIAEDPFRLPTGVRASVDGIVHYLVEAAIGGASPCQFASRCVGRQLQPGLQEAQHYLTHRP